MIGEFVDGLIGVLSPSWGVRRMAARTSMTQIESFGLYGLGGYDAGKLNRFTRTSQGTALNENAVPRMQIDRLRWQSWNLYRNNPHCRKIVRTINAKVAHLHPQSQAKNADGSPNVEFRARAHHLFDDFSKICDYRGRPGFGGQTLDGMAETALRGVILGGEILFRSQPASTAEQKKYGLPVPLQLQLVAAERIAESITTVGEKPIYNGVELDDEGRPAAYHILPFRPGEPLMILPASISTLETVRIPADKIGHFFVSEDIDQLRGVPWMASALSQMRDIGDYQFNELKASALAACVTLGVRRPTGATMFGAQTSDWELTDPNGNKLTSMQPGMVIDLGTDGAIDGFDPWPNAGAEAFMQFMLRTTAAALPGIKGSTLTGDYRGSSFSSERSADNDVWPELQGVQDWFGDNFYQPIYCAVIEAGIESGYFDGIVTAGEFQDRKADFLACIWQGPVALSINPTDDAAAAKQRIEAGISSVPMECAKIGINWRDVLKSTAEYVQHATEIGLKDTLIDQFAGLNSKVGVADVATNQANPGDPNADNADNADAKGPEKTNGARNKALFERGGLTNGHQTA